MVGTWPLHKSQLPAAHPLTHSLVKQKHLGTKNLIHVDLGEAETRLLPHWELTMGCWETQTRAVWGVLAANYFFGWMRLKQMGPNQFFRFKFLSQHAMHDPDIYRTKEPKQELLSSVWKQPWVKKHKGVACCYGRWWRNKLDYNHLCSKFSPKWHAFLQRHAHIRSNFLFSILLKDTSTLRQEELGIGPPTPMTDGRHARPPELQLRMCA